MQTCSQSLVSWASRRKDQRPPPPLPFPDPARCHRPSQSPGSAGADPSPPSSPPSAAPCTPCPVQPGRQAQGGWQVRSRRCFLATGAGRAVCRQPRTPSCSASMQPTHILARRDVAGRATSAVGSNALHASSLCRLAARHRGRGAGGCGGGRGRSRRSTTTAAAAAAAGEGRSQRSGNGGLDVSRDALRCSCGVAPSCAHAGLCRGGG